MSIEHIETYRVYCEIQTEVKAIDELSTSSMFDYKRRVSTLKGYRLLPANDISIMIDYKFVAKLQRNLMVCVRKVSVFLWKIFTT